jgi:hypothetical protein
VTAGVVALAAAVICLGVLVFGLLRGQAEILRLLDDLRGPPPRQGRVGTAAVDIEGVSPAGDRIGVDVKGARLAVLVFLTSSCEPCHALWEALGKGAGGELPGRPSVVAVTPSPSTESRRKVAELAAGDAAVVMSTEAWQAYGVATAPFCVVIARGVLRSEAPLRRWSQVAELLEDVLGAGRGSRP